MTDADPLDEAGADEPRAELRELASRLDREPWVIWRTVVRNDRSLHVALTQRLQRRARSERVWGSPQFFNTLRNARYGFDPSAPRSRGGRDGIFIVDRNHRPANSMMVKLFHRFLDRPESGAGELAAALGVGLADLMPVRLVSHHLRLLGVLAQQGGADWLVFVDVDRDK